jgi:hypothetical protein
MRLRAFVLGWLLLCGCRSGGSGPFRQSLDSASSACRTNPAYCASLPGGLRGGAQAGASVAGVVKVLDAATKERIKDILSKCANQADLEVNLRLLGGQTPTAEQCAEQVGTDADGKPVTRAMRLGQEKHLAARICVQSQLSSVLPGGFSLEPRYRYSRVTRVLEWIPEEEAQALIRSGRAAMLRGTIIPDVVLHSGNPIQAEASYDFKFPCPIGDVPNWRRYPKGHPFEGRLQGAIYGEALNAPAFRVAPILGVF